VPYKPKRPCCYPGCGALVDKGYCTKHKQSAISDPDRQRFETSAQWGRIRRAVLNDEPLCVDCKAENRVTLASEVHHIDGDYRHNQVFNLVGLCSHCHGKHTRGVKC
jgi:5-methylcytosine-specific restriction protein A